MYMKAAVIYEAGGPQQLKIAAENQAGSRPLCERRLVAYKN